MEKLNKLNFADEAEKVIISLQEEDRQGKKRIRVTTSKIRNLLAMSNNLYNQMLKEPSKTMSQELQSNIQYFKMKVAYEAGRERSVEEFVKNAHLIDHINDVGDSKEKLLLFCKYMESLVAYHRFHGGKDR